MSLEDIDKLADQHPQCPPVSAEQVALFKSLRGE